MSDRDRLLTNLAVRIGSLSAQIRTWDKVLADLERVAAKVRGYRNVLSRRLVRLIDQRNALRRREEGNTKVDLPKDDGGTGYPDGREMKDYAE